MLIIWPKGINAVVMLDFEKVKPCSTGMECDLLRGILNVDGKYEITSWNHGYISR